MSPKPRLKPVKNRRFKQRGPARLGPGEEKARAKILKAARLVFAQHPFKSASTRLIAELAGIEHPLIHYYFGSKARLFEAVARDLYEEFNRANQSWLEGLEKTMPEKGLSLYLDRLVDYAFENPEALQIIFLNMAQVGGVEEIPGFHYIRLHLKQVSRTVARTVHLRGSRADYEMFIHCFNNLVISLLGPRHIQAQVLKLDPDSRAYRAWVKQALYRLFLPWLEKLVFPAKN